MKKSILCTLAALLSAGLALSACDDGDKSTSDAYSAREAAAANAGGKSCSINLVTGTCSADKLSIASISCDGQTVGTNVSCPPGTQCITIDEGIGNVAYCVLAEDVPECVISTCNGQDNKQLKDCVNGKWANKTCGKDQVCRQVGKDAKGNDLAAKCVDRPAESSITEENELDVCAKSGYGRVESSKCSADLKQSIYTCNGGHVITETCYPYQCETANLKKMLEDAIADNPALGIILSQYVAIAPTQDMHGCHLKTALQAALGALSLGGGI